MNYFWKKLLSLGLVMGLLLAGIPSAGALTGDEVPPVGQTSSTDWKKLLAHSEPALPQEGTYAPNRLLVTRVDSGMRAMSLGHESITGTDPLFSLDMPRQAQEVMQLDTEETEKITCTAVSLAEGSDMLSVMNDLSQEPGVLAVEVDRLHTLDSVVEGGAEAVPQVLAPAQDSFTPARDPFVAQQTWLEFMGATKAWDMVTAQNKVPGAGVVVAVLDSGITTTHPDLKDQIVPGGRQFWLDTGVKPNIVRNDATIEDGNGHGTHVSGMIAGAKNGTGITGVAYGAKILPIKVLSNEGSGYDSAIAVGMLYAAGLVDENGVSTPAGEPRCDIANMSLGGNSGEPSTVYETAVAAMRKAGVFLVVAAGNDESATSDVNPANLYASYTMPAYVTGAFTVMAMQETARENGDYLTYFSNWDSDPYAGAEYTLMAPGNKILSSVPEKLGSYTRYSGTSMASPATAGAAALVLGANPGYTPEDLWSVLATSGQVRQGKTDQGGKKYSYHMLDVAAALNTKPASVKSMVKGTVAGNWKEAPELGVLNRFALVMPTDGTLPQIKLTLRGYDGEAYNFSATGAGLRPTKDRVTYLAPGSEAELVFTLEKMPTTDIFKTEIAVTWTNEDGSAGSETVPVILSVIKAAPGAELLDRKYVDLYQNKGIEVLWVFKNKVDITLPTKPVTGAAAAPVPQPFPLINGIYYFGEDGSLTVTKSKDYSNLTFWRAGMFNPQISGDVHMWMANMEGIYDRKKPSIINITGGMNGCVIDGYEGLNLTVSEWIDSTTIANSAGSSITAGTICNSTLMNNFLFGPSENKITEIIVTEPTHVGTSGSDSTGFYNNAVIGPAKVSYKEVGKAAVPATALACYYLPTANMGDNGYGIGVPSDSNKLECAAVGSEVYVEGVNEKPRPTMLENCPAFLISIKRVPDTTPITRDQHLSYRLESEFSNASKKEKPFGYCSYLMPDGNFEAENIVWAEDGLSCTYTVYTSSNYEEIDDIYALTDLDMPLQYDVRNLIHDRLYEEIDLDVTAGRVDNKFEITWTKPANYDKLTGGKLFCWNMADKRETVIYELPLGTTELAAEKITISDPTLNAKIVEGTQWGFLVNLWRNKETNSYYIATGETVYYEAYNPSGEDIALEVDKVDGSGTLNLSGVETATLTLRATKSFNMKNGLKIIMAFTDKDALEITSVEPGSKVFSGIARDGNQTVIELAPAEVTKEIKYRDQFVFKDETIATLTIQGKNVASEGPVMLHLQDFLGNDLLGVDGEPLTFAFNAKTTAVSYDGGGDYNPPKKDTGTQTLPDGTLVTTTTNPDGSIQIVYKSPDGVSSTVKTPAKKGEASTASISLPPALAGTSVKVPIPVAAGGINTVAVLVGADGKEQVIPGSFWKDGVLTVPLTGNATILIRDNAKTFGDVAADHWAADAIAFVTSRELFQGDDKGFQPAGDTTRGMLVTVLARLDGQNTAGGPRWDSVGTAWAKERGISSGSDMEAAVTREQLAVMLYRYAKAEQGKGDLTGFSDAADLSPWARDAMQWAVGTGIISGTNGALNPQGNASRAEVAAMLARFVAKA